MFNAVNALLLVGVFCAVGHAQRRNVALTIKESPCSSCHACDRPTQGDPCLVACPRTVSGLIERKLARKRPPDLVILDELEELYSPVRFDHQGHADMADMIDGCTLCHHHTPEGTGHPACKSCHEISPQQEDIRKPSLKNAYHRLCMSCHREWSGTTQCVACHPAKIGNGQNASLAEGLLSRTHPPPSEPHTRIYECNPESEPASKVVFRHKEHVHRFGLKCAYCHQEDTCSRCHRKREENEHGESTPGEHHVPCSRCHDVQNRGGCGHCHWTQGEAKPKPFEHAGTGWVLDGFHVTLACRTCHKDVPYRKLDRDCDTCHTDWSPASFDHAVAGQVLDKSHEDADCAACHVGRKFDRPPTCNECHNEDEGIAFPEKRPGQLVIPSHRESERSPGG